MQRTNAELANVRATAEANGQKWPSGTRAVYELGRADALADMRAEGAEVTTRRGDRTALKEALDALRVAIDALQKVEDDGAAERDVEHRIDHLIVNAFDGIYSAQGYIETAETRT